MQAAPLTEKLLRLSGGNREDWLPNPIYAPNAKNKRRQGFAFQHMALSGTLKVAPIL